MEFSKRTFSRTVTRDLLSGLIVFLVALPLCLGIALASGAPLFSGLVAGIVGGIVVGILSGSHTSVTGPAAGLTAIVAAQIARLGSFETFLVAVVIGGILQILLGLIKAGALSAFFPSSVIKGLLAAIGVILIMKQIPHLVGYDGDRGGEMSFLEPDQEISTSLVLPLIGVRVYVGALMIGLSSVVLLAFWDNSRRLKNSLIPGPLVVVLLGVLLAQLFQRLGSAFVISSEHCVQVPVASSIREFWGFLQFPDFRQLVNPAVYVGGITIAMVASLETLLNLDAVDKLDKKQRLSPPSRELLAQGVGNMASGLLGGLPVTSVVIRGSVNINAGAESKLSAIFHGILLLVCVAVLPTFLNTVPLSCLAAILLLTGFKLASPKLFRQMWSEGLYQFLPFILTLISIVLTDLLVGILIGLAVSLTFILYSNLRRPVRRIREKHAGGEVLHIELSNQVSFLNRAALESAMREAPDGSCLLLDARRTHYIDPDILSLIREFKEVTAPVHNIQVHLLGFRSHYKYENPVDTVNLLPQELREQLTPKMVQEILAEGNLRFIEGHPLDRDFRHPADRSAEPPRAMAAILTGIDSRTPVEMIFDLAFGDAYVIRMPGNVVGSRAVGGLEFAVMNGARLIVVMGHTQSRLVTAALRQRTSLAGDDEVDACRNLASVLDDIGISIDASDAECYAALSDAEKQALIDTISRRHVARSVQQVLQLSPAISRAVADGRVLIVPAMHHVMTSRVEFLE